jgi:hypothetical protein
MFYSLGSNEVLETCAYLAKPYLVGTGPRSTDNLSLGLAWRRMLTDEMGESNVDSHLVGWNWISRSEQIDVLDHLFRDESCYSTHLDFGEPARSWPDLDDQHVVSDGWRFLLTQEPDLGEIASILIATIFSTKSPRRPGSGSLPSRRGTIFINPTDSWDSRDVVECLIREVTHQAIWNDHLRYRHYPMPEPNIIRTAMIPTSQDGKYVSLPRALALVIVGAELLRYRQRNPSANIPNESSAVLMERSVFIAEQIRGVPSIEKFTTGRFWRALNAAEDQVVAKRR